MSSRVSRRVSMARFADEFCDTKVAGVYAIAAYGCCAVKIGWSGDVVERLKTLGTGMPFELELIGVIPGESCSTEKNIHQQLADWHLRGEWFAWCDEVRSFINRHFDLSVEVSERKSAAIASFPFLDFDAEDDCKTTLAAGYSAIPPYLRAQLARLVDGDSSRPLTIEEFSRLVLTGHAEKQFNFPITRERWRQIKVHFMQYILKVSEPDCTLINLINLDRRSDGKEA